MSKIIFVSFYLSVGKVLDEVDKYNSELSLLAEDYEQKNIYVLENVPLESKNQVTNIQEWLWENFTDIFIALKAKMKILNENVKKQLKTR